MNTINLIIIHHNIFIRFGFWTGVKQSSNTVHLMSSRNIYYLITQ